MKITDALQIPWAKALLLVLNLKSIPFGIHKFSSFEIVAEHPMHLAPSSFETQLIKGNIFQYFKTPITFIKNTHALVEQSFHTVSLGDKDFT